MGDEKILKWRFDVSTFRLIGRDLITDRITALFELVKNCYDANATEVEVSFENVGIDAGTADKSRGRITIKDNGFGMSFEDIRDKWMVIGTSNKRKNPISPAPFFRRCVGEKGIGRFAVDKLGDKVNIITKRSNSDGWLNVEIDWNLYYNQANDDGGIQLFTDIENRYEYIPSSNSEVSGTTLIIENVREIWSEDDVKRFIREASKIVSPYANLNPPFQIRVLAPEFAIKIEVIESISDIDDATLSLDIAFDKERGTQETLYFEEESGKIQKKNIKIKEFGGISMRLFYFDDKARRAFRKKYPNNEIDGVKIYRDGVITTPFAEREDDANKKRDILGIDKRLWQDIFNKVSTREIIGIVDISKQENPNIIDATNRQDFNDNDEYRALKEFIILQISAIEDYKIYLRKNRKKDINSELNNAKQDIDDLVQSASDIAEAHPQLQPQLNKLISTAKKTGKSVKAAIAEHKKAEEEFIRKENMYMSIMSLQEYAIHITHAVRTSLNKIKRKADFFKEFYPDPEEEKFFLLYAKEISEEMEILDKVINYMLSYSQSNFSFQDIDLQKLIADIIQNYRTKFDYEGIKAEYAIGEQLIISSNRQFFYDILQNLIDNSIKAMKHVDEKILKCTAFTDNNELIIKISDTGVGIPDEKKEWVFGLYNTTTEKDGGAGIGLYVVKTRVESLKGNVKIINSEFGDVGTTIQITLPFKK